MTPFIIRPVFFAALMALASCLSDLVETRDSVMSREEILFESEVQFGRILLGGNNMSWENTSMEFVLTPSSVYLLATDGSYSITIPFQVIDEVSVRDVPFWFWWPFNEPDTISDLLVINTDQVNCWEGCVFRFQDSRLGHTVVTIINRQQAKVDPFGRLEGPREFGLVTSDREVFLDWRPRPAFLQRRHPEVIVAMDRLLEELSPQLAAAFNEALVEAMDKGFDSDPEPNWQLRRVEGPTGEQLVYYETFPEKTAELLAAEPDLDSILYVRLNRIFLVEKISAQYVPSIQLSFTADLYFRNLVPPSPGLVLQVVHDVQYSPDAWLNNDGGLLFEEVRALASATAENIRLVLHGSENAP